MKRKILLLLLMGSSLGSMAQPLSGGSADATGRMMHIYTASSGGGNPGPVPSPSRYFGAVGQSVAITFNPNPGPPAFGIPTSAGIMSAANFIFSSTTSAAPVPTAQPTGISFSSITQTSYTVSFTPASPAPAGYLVLRKAGSAITANPSVGVAYTVSSTLADATVIAVGAGTSVTQPGLTPGTIYYYAVFSFNGTGATTSYLTVSPLVGSSLSAPAPSQPTALTFSNVTTTSLTGDFTAAAGADGYMVLRKVGSVPASLPANATVYTAGNTIGDANVVYVGTAPTFNDISLTPGTNYFYEVLSYKGTGISTNYLTSAPLTANRSTLAAEPTGQPSFLAFSSVTATTLTATFSAAAGPPSGYIAVRSSGAAPNTVPVDGTNYVAGDPLGNGVVAFIGSAVTFDDTGLLGGISYFYAVYSYNGAAGSYNFLTAGPATGTQQTTAGDTTPPGVASNTLTKVAPATNLIVKATATETAPGSVTSVSLEYRSVAGTATYTTVPMVLTSGTSLSGSWEFTILGSQIGELGVDYKITATNSAALTATTTGKTVIDHTNQTVPYSAFGSAITNYRIISMPLQLTGNKVSDVFGSLGTNKTDWRVYHYQNSSTVEMSTSSTLDPGQGYWLIVKNSNTINTGAGTTVSTQPFTISLSTGWNQIGNPYLFNLLWSDVMTASGGLSLKLRTYSGNFNDGTVLNKFEGGFVNAGGSVTLTIPVIKNPAAGRGGEIPTKRLTNSLDQKDWEVNLTLQNSDRINVFGGLGMNSKANPGRDDFDDFTLPRFLDYVELNHGKTFVNSAYTKDVVPTQENYTWEFTVESNLEGTTNMVWDNSYFGKTAKELVLVDVEQSTIVDMKSTSSYAFTSTESNKFKAVFGSKEYVLEHSLPNEILINKVYPNPSGGQVTVGFTLPNSATPISVQVKLVNMMGQTVTKVFDGNLNPGYHEVKWNGLDDQNLRPAQGLYFMQVQGGKVTQQQRVILK